VCFRQQGLFSPYRYGFTGADCSLRTCPLGKAFDRISSSTPGIAPVVFKPSTLPGAKSNNKLSAVFISAAQSSGYRAQRRDQKFVVRIMTTSAVANSPVAPYGTFAWRFEEDEYYQPEDEIGLYSSPTKSYALSKSSDMSTGVYIYWDPRKGNTPTFETEAGEIAAGDTYEFTLFYNEGDAFEGSDSNTAHQLIECSGRGTCDYESGKCGCLVGYTGEACQRTICPAQCSGHGSCQTELRFASDGLPANALANGYAAAYDGDQQYGCKCDKGYRGSDCGLSESPRGEGGKGGGRTNVSAHTSPHPTPPAHCLTPARSPPFFPSFPLPFPPRSRVPVRPGRARRGRWLRGHGLLEPRPLRLRHGRVQVLQGLLRRALRVADHARLTSSALLHGRGRRGDEVRPLSSLFCPRRRGPLARVAWWECRDGVFCAAGICARVREDVPAGCWGGVAQDADVTQTKAARFPFRSLRVGVGEKGRGGTTICGALWCVQLGLRARDEGYKRFRPHSPIKQHTPIDYAASVDWMSHETPV
jgi:hypothetical protein